LYPLFGKREIDVFFNKRMGIVSLLRGPSLLMLIYTDYLITSDNYSFYTLIQKASYRVHMYMYFSIICYNFVSIILGYKSIIV